MSNASGLVPLAGPEEILPRASLTPEEVRTEMPTLKVAARFTHIARHNEQRLKRGRDITEKRSIRKPWLYEAQGLMADPPNINYRTLIISDQYTIDRLVEDEDLHFSQRCLEHQQQDIRIESDLLREYFGWAILMNNYATKVGQVSRKSFFEELKLVLTQDREVFGDKLKNHRDLTEKRQDWIDNLESLEPGTLKCFCSGCASDKHKTRHRELKTIAKKAGIVDFAYGVKGCDCDDCEPKMRLLKERRQELHWKAEFTNRAILGCDCEDCEEVQIERLKHKDLKHRQRLQGQTDFRKGVIGCECNDCETSKRLAEREHYSAQHEKLKSKDALSGNTNCKGGVPGCSCWKCREAARETEKLKHNELKCNTWLQGNNDFYEHGVSGCSCGTCDARKRKFSVFWIV